VDGFIGGAQGPLPPALTSSEYHGASRRTIGEYALGASETFKASCLF